MAEVNEVKENEVNKTEVNKTEIKEKEKKSGGNHTVLIVVIILLIGFIAFLAYKKLTKKEEVDLAAIPAVNVTHISKGKVEKKISVTGTVLPSDTYYIPAKVGGDLKEIYVKNGDYVKKGDPICEIDASKEIEAAFIQYDAAKKSYERMEKLYRAGDISAQSFETVKAQYDGAKLSYDTKVEYATPVAVGDGIVENTDMIINTSISAGKVLCYITSDDAKEVNFGVTERILSGIKLGDKVVVEKNGKSYDGYISDIASLINSQTGLFNVKAVITSENTFASGIMAKVTFVYDKRKNVDILPNEVVYYEAGNAFVYTVKNDGVITKKYIEVGIEDEIKSEIVSGLDKADKIVSTWHQDLAEGTTVNIVKNEMPEDEIELFEVERIIFDEVATKSELHTIDVASESTIDLYDVVEAASFSEAK